MHENCRNCGQERRGRKITHEIYQKKSICKISSRRSKRNTKQPAEKLQWIKGNKGSGSLLVMLYIRILARLQLSAHLYTRWLRPVTIYKVALMTHQKIFKHWHLVNIKCPTSFNPHLVVRGAHRPLAYISNGSTLV